MTSVRAQRPSTTHRKRAVTSVAATAGSLREDEQDWRASDSSTTAAGRRPGLSRTASRQVREPREISPTRSSAGARPRRLARFALVRMEGDPIRGYHGLGGTMSQEERVELSAAAKKELSASRWLAERLRKASTFAAFATWLDRLEVWCKGATGGKSLAQIGPHSLRLIMSQAVEEEVYTHLRYGPTWTSDQLKWSQLR